MAQLNRVDLAGSETKVPDMVPVRPSEFFALVVQPEDDLCERMKKTFIRLPVLFYKLISYMFTMDGSFTTQFENDICAIPCTPFSVTGTTTTTT